MQSFSLGRVPDILYGAGRLADLGPKATGLAGPAAAVMLVGLTIAALNARLDESPAVASVKARTGLAIETTSAMFNAWRSELWKQ